ncbi:heavy-metal-associated domain-containing protein [Streptomyces sp. TR06-5]|uniref:heavy-metal-associated domain-containing protein n=1 Tax=unclassified Streptomyces TaxID=2593676 RepID=UPI0039A19ABF
MRGYPDRRASRGVPRMDATTTSRTYRVTGMSCGHCEGAVVEEVSALAGVVSAEASAQNGTLIVVSDNAPAEEAVRAAVEEAGYELAGRA